jgi:hypothetical protein
MGVERASVAACRVCRALPRRSYGLAYDSRRRRVVLIGGLAADPRRFLADTWTWDGTSWMELPADGHPGPGSRSHATLVDDVSGGRLLYFGGTTDGKLLQELWLFDHSGWRHWRP